MATSEIEKTFARERSNYIVFIPGHSPYAMHRLTHADVERLRLDQLQGRLAITAVDPQAVPALPSTTVADAGLGQPARQRPRRPTKEPVPA